MSSGTRSSCPDELGHDFYRPVPVELGASERTELPTGFTIMFAGNLGSVQSLETVIDAAERLRDEDVHWVFIGDGNQREILEQERVRRGLTRTVHLLGKRPAEAMPRYLALADALLVSLRPDPSFASTIPAKLQSSLAMGRPVLAALEGEGARIVHDAGAGVVVPPSDAVELAGAALVLKRMPESERQRLGENGRRYSPSQFQSNSVD